MKRFFVKWFVPLNSLLWGPACLIFHIYIYIYIYMIMILFCQ